MAKKKTGTEAPETHSFQAETAKLLHLMVHSVYSDRDVFLRELVSNAADALDKLRYEAIGKPELLAGDLKISIRPDKTAKTLTVSDTGIGMDREELISNLGTIARSGTQAFMEKAGQGDLKLIGQFGVGFYSSFIVADKVEVVSRKAGNAEAWKWTSDGAGSFTVEPAEAKAAGTAITMHLKEDAGDYLEDWKLEGIVRTYSDHVAHPIMLTVDAETAKQINAANAIWMRPKSEITAEQHKEFFGHISGSYSDPALTIHYKAEGRHEYTVLLYVPAEKPFDLYDPERKGRQKLHVKRVFIADDAELLPPWLRFVRGIVDSEDMPLNLSREMLQDNPQVAAMRKALTNRVLAELKKCAENDAETYNKIWAAFGAVLKEGLYEDMERRDALYELARFKTTKAENVSLKDYIAGLKENQTAIYYLTGEDAGKATRSPQLEGYRARDVEVLLLTDPVDSFWVRMALGYEGKPFKSVTQGGADLDQIKAKEEAKPAEDDASATGALIALIKQTLGDAVKDVRKSSRLTDSAVCLVADDAGLDRTLEKLLAKQKASGATVSAPVLEVNAGHPLIVSLATQAKVHGASPRLEDAARLLLDQARIMEGEPVDDPQGFARRLSDALSASLT